MCFADADEEPSHEESGDGSGEENERALGCQRPTAEGDGADMGP